jgi:hypothetical protein
MSGRSGSSFAKLQKERARREKQLEKQARRQQRKLDRQTARSGHENSEELPAADFPGDVPHDSSQ